MPTSRIRGILGGIFRWGLVLSIVVGGFTSARWWPRWNRWLDGLVVSASQRPTPAQQNDGNDDHDHDHGSHSHHDDSELTLSKQALQNLGLTTGQIQPLTRTSYFRSVTVPARLSERPGRSRLSVATPITAVITRVHADLGQAVNPGDVLFDVRLTHKDLVNAQVDFLRTLGELDVELREIERLQEGARTGAIAGRVLLEREYARDRLQAILDAQRESLRLHGLSVEQIGDVVQTRRLLRDLTIAVPSPDLRNNIQQESQTVQLAGLSDSIDSNVQPLTIHTLIANKGDAVESGDTLCVLVDPGQILIEGLAFEQDAPTVLRAVDRGWPVAAGFQKPGGGMEWIEQLPIEFVAPQIDSDSRILKFYVDVENQIVRDAVSSDGRRFVSWLYRPGQRMQLRIPVEKWENQIVLPIDAVAFDGPDCFVFKQHGRHFRKIAVRVILRDQDHVVIEERKGLKEGDLVAMRSAHQMLMALRKRAAPVTDPHAGHTH